MCHIGWSPHTWMQIDPTEQETNPSHRSVQLKINTTQTTMQSRSKRATDAQGASRNTYIHEMCRRRNDRRKQPGEGTATIPSEQKTDWNGPRFRLAHQETAVQIQARDLPAPFQSFPYTRGHPVRIASHHHVATVHDATVAGRSRKAGTASLETHAPSECCGWLEEPPTFPMLQRDRTDMSGVPQSSWPPRSTATECENGARLPLKAVSWKSIDDPGPSRAHAGTTKRCAMNEQSPFACLAD